MAASICSEIWSGNPVYERNIKLRFATGKLKSFSRRKMY